jgi:hypothetical protein
VPRTADDGENLASFRHPAEAERRDAVGRRATNLRGAEANVAIVEKPFLGNALVDAINKARSQG